MEPLQLEAQITKSEDFQDAPQPSAGSRSSWTCMVRLSTLFAIVAIVTVAACVSTGVVRPAALVGRFFASPASFVPRQGTNPLMPEQHPPFLSGQQPAFRLAPGKKEPVTYLNAAITETEERTDTDIDDDDDESGLMEGERYVSFNRYQVRDGLGGGPRFEQYFADRKHHVLKGLRGFRFFTLLRRVNDLVIGDKLVTYEDGTPDYATMTVWRRLRNFKYFHQGHPHYTEAYKEAHSPWRYGSGFIDGFIKGQVGGMMVVKSTPSMANWDGLSTVSLPAKYGPEIDQRALDFPFGEGLTRAAVMADGVQQLPEEIFVAQNRFAVKPERANDFEEHFAKRQADMKKQSGFVGSMILRRDHSQEKVDGGGGRWTSKSDDNYNYEAMTIWKSKKEWETWRLRREFSPVFWNSPSLGPQEDHGRLDRFFAWMNKKSADTADVFEKVNKKEEEEVKEMLSAPTSPVFWEGVLVVQGDKGV